jgi:hypothetical protein
MTEETKLAKVEPMPLVQQEINYPAMLEMAIKSKDVDVEKLERIAALVHRSEDRRAHAAFNRAFAQFHDECPAIIKNKDAKIATKSGSGYGYTYADLPGIANTIKAPLRNNDLTYTWDSSTNDKGVLSCTCRLVHVDGHSIVSTFQCPTDSASGSSAAQKYGAALTYAKRQSLVSILGLTSCDEDTDAARPAPEPVEQKPAQTITEDQANDLNDMIIQKGSPKAILLKHYGVEKLGDMSVENFKNAMYRLGLKSDANNEGT